MNASLGLQQVKEILSKLNDGGIDISVDLDNHDFLAITYKTYVEKINSFFGSYIASSIFYNDESKKLILSISTDVNQTPENSLFVNLPINDHVIQALENAANYKGSIEIYFGDQSMENIRMLKVLKDEIAINVLQRELHKLKNI